MTYWLNLFTGTTWVEFQKAGSAMSGFRYHSAARAGWPMSFGHGRTDDAPGTLCPLDMGKFGTVGSARSSLHDRSGGTFHQALVTLLG